MMCMARLRAAFAFFFIFTGYCVLDRPIAAAQTLPLEQVGAGLYGQEHPGWSLSPGHMSGDDGYGSTIDMSWTELPKVIDPSGFNLTVTFRAQRAVTEDHRESPNMIQGSLAVDPNYIVLSGSQRDFSVNLYEGQSQEITMQYTIVPRGNLTAGQEVSFYFSAAGGPIFEYRYRLGGGSGTATNSGPITAELVDCPPSIVISELPSVFCHLRISNFRHNTADPVQVILPSTIDMQGNHGNGLQLPQTASSLDVANMEDPYMWGVTIFACPGQPGAAVNCNGTAAKAETLTVPIVVHQDNTGDTQVMVSINAVAGPNSVVADTGGGTSVTTPIPAGPGQIGASMDCPGAITISAVPSLNCSVIITGWIKDSAAPVKVMFPSVGDFGTNGNGIQLTGAGEEDHFSWDNEDSHAWPITVFACPGENCGDRVTQPGEMITLIWVEQQGLEPAVLAFRIFAKPAQ